MTEGSEGCGVRQMQPRLTTCFTPTRWRHAQVLDEPTSSLDAEVEEKIFDTLQADKGERITLVVSHRAATLASMDAIYVVGDGEIVQSGTFDELVTDPDGPFMRLFRRQLVLDPATSEPDSS